MTASTRTAAQHRTDRIRLFRAELACLRDEGVLQLSAAQHEAVERYHDRLLEGYTARFDVDRDERAQQLSWGMRIASVLGALAFAAGVFFLFQHFRLALGEVTQLAVVFAAVLGLFGLTLWLHPRDRSGYFTALAALAAFASFVLHTTLIGEMFNLTPSSAVLAPWAAFALLLAYHCKLRLLLVVGLGCVIAWAAANVQAWSGAARVWIDLGDRPEHFIPIALVLFGVPYCVRHERRESFPAVYRAVGLLTVLFAIFVLGYWGAASYLPGSVHVLEAFYQGLGFVVSAAAVWLGLRHGWPETVNTGLVFFVVFLYAKLFDWWWALMPRYAFFLLLGVCSVLVLLVARRVRQGRRVKS